MTTDDKSTDDMTTRADLIGKVFPVLDGGFVKLVDVFGSDAAICEAARVTTGTGSKGTEKDRGLIRFLVSHSELSPLEQASIKLHVRMPIYLARQFMRYRTAKVQEYSARYREAIDAAQTTPVDGWRKQAEDNRQGSDGLVTDWPEGRFDMRWEASDPEAWEESMRLAPGEYVPPGAFLSHQEAGIQRHAREVYAERLKFGVAREQARKDLPLSTFSEIIWTNDLRNVLHMLRERLAPNAQAEMREIAHVIAYRIVNPLFPLVFDAFEDYILGSMTLSRMDIIVAREVTRGATFYRACELAGLTNRREVAECRAKLARLGLIDDKPNPEPLP
jgi:thymidylate synthase (FAD)